MAPGRKKELRPATPDDFVSTLESVISTGCTLAIFTPLPISVVSNSIATRQVFSIPPRILTLFAKPASLPSLEELKCF